MPVSLGQAASGDKGPKAACPRLIGTGRGVLFSQCQLSSAGHTNPVGVSWTGLHGASLGGVAWVLMVGWLHAGLPPPLKLASLAHYPSPSCLSLNPTWARPQTLTLQN